MQRTMMSEEEHDADALEDYRDALKTIACTAWSIQREIELRYAPWNILKLATIAYREVLSAMLCVQEHRREWLTGGVDVNASCRQRSYGGGILNAIKEEAGKLASEVHYDANVWRMLQASENLLYLADSLCRQNPTPGDCPSVASGAEEQTVDTGVDAQKRRA